MKRIYLAVLALAVLVTACELPDNVDPKAPSTVPTGTIVTNAMVTLANHIDDKNQNVNVHWLFAQYATQNTYVDESRYNLGDRQIPDNYWNVFYRDIIQDIREAKSLYEEQSGSDDFNRARDNRIAILEVMEVYAWQSLVDAFGGVPYTEALGGIENTTPVYDDGPAIYADLLSRMAAALTTLSANADAGSFGSEDVIFGGDTDLWVRTAASLHLRMAMRLADVQPSVAEANVTAALNFGVLEEGESFQLNYTGVAPHVNEIYNHFEIGNRSDFNPPATIIDILKNTNDPRLPLYASTKPGTDEYIGMEYGLAGGAAYQEFSHFSDQMFAATWPAVMIEYAEVQMLLAIANELYGFTTPMSAQEHYEAAVTASVVWWGGDPADAAAYLAADGAYDPSREALGTQIWLICYNRGNSGWDYWRQFDAPTLHVPEDLSATDIPLRLNYPFNEASLNGANYEAAAAKMNGDDVRTQLFWDATPNAK